MKALKRASALIAALMAAAAVPAAANEGDGQDKVTICHATGSESNPYEAITIAEPAAQAHMREHGDFALPASGNCEDGPDDGDDDDGGGGGGPFPT